VAVRRKDPVKTGQVDFRLLHQGRQPRDAVQRLEDDVGGAVAVRGLQLVEDVAVRRARQALLGNRRTADVAAQPVELLALIRSRP
jgi:hypothetical protein